MKTNADLFAERGDAWDAFRCMEGKTKRDQEILAEQRKPEPPSKAHRKRLARAGYTYRETEPLPKARETERSKLLRHQLNVRNSLLAALGGTTTVVPFERKPVPPATPKAKPVPKSDAERRAAEIAALEAEGVRLARSTAEALAKMVYHDVRNGRIVPAE